MPEYRVRFWLDKTRDWCVVIPVINEGERIHRLLERMQRLQIPNIADIVIADGGSTDGSLRVPALGALDVCGLLEKTGPGRLSAQLRCAYAFALEAGYHGVVTIDGNDKDDPQAIPRFIDALQGGIDFVQGSRFIPGGIGENTPWLRLLAIRWIHAPLLSICSRFRWTDTTQGFRGYSRRLLIDPRIGIFRDVFDGYELLAYLSYRAPRLGYRCVEVPTTRRYPPNAVPTKITGFRGSWLVLTSLLRACFRRLDP